MTAAAFKGTYADFKLIKTRGVVSISFEIPLQDVDLAYQVLGGMPDTAKERWFGIAALKLDGNKPVEAADPNQAAAAPHDRPHPARKPVAADKKLAQQAGILCADPVFRAYLNEEGPIGIGPIIDEEAAALAVRELCGVLSRAELVPGSSAAARWEDLHGKFLAWKLVA